MYVFNTSARFIEEVHGDHEPTYDDLAEQTDHSHGYGAGAVPQDAGVPQPRDDPPDIVRHIRSDAYFINTTIT